MKKVQEEPTALKGDLDALLPKVDFADTFSTTNHIHSMEAIVKKVLNQAPGWVNTLMRLRNRIVKVFGLKTSMPDDYNTEYKVGGYVSFFKIYAIEAQRVILGANDKHLNFRLAIDKTTSPKYNIKVATLVEYNNRFGRVYMAIVKPFHKLVLKSMVRKAYCKN